MAKVFEMTRRAREPLDCDDCGDTIEAGERWSKFSGENQERLSKQ